MQPTLATPATSSVTMLDVADVSLELGVAADASAAVARCAAATSPRVGARRRRFGVALPMDATARASSMFDARARVRRAGDGGGVDEGDFDRVVVARARDDVDARAMAMDAMTTPRGGAECGAARAATRRRLERDARWRQLSVM